MTVRFLPKKWKNREKFVDARAIFKDKALLMVVITYYFKCTIEYDILRG